MEKMHTFLRWTTLLLFFFSTVTSLHAQDTQVTEYYRTGVGNFDIAQGGAALYDACDANPTSNGCTSASFTVDIPNCGGTFVIDRVFISYYSRLRQDNGVAPPTFDDEIDVEVNGNGVNSLTATNTFNAVLDAGSNRTYYRVFGVIDATAALSGDLVQGTNTVEVDDFDLPPIGAGVNNAEHYGVAMTVIYSCSTLPLTEVVYGAGLDFWWNGSGSREYQGQYSQEYCVSLPSMADGGQNIEIGGVWGGQANSASPFRGHQVWAVTGSGTPPSITLDGNNQPDDAIISASGAQQVGQNNIFISDPGTEWDVYTGGATINFNNGDTYVCIQAWSVQSGGSDSGISGDLLAPILVIPVMNVVSCNLTDAMLAGLTCVDANSTPSDATDDELQFTLNPQGTGTGAMYNVSVSSGTISPTSASYGSAQTFTLQDGSAGSGNVTVTITDATTGTCTLPVTIMDPGSCSTPPPPGICDCEEYIYINEVPPNFGNGDFGSVHKFRVNIDGTLDEVYSDPANQIPWYPRTGSMLPSPHGLGTDLNGFIYIGSAIEPSQNPQQRKFLCDGTIQPVDAATINQGSFNSFSIGNELFINTFTGDFSAGGDDDVFTINAFDLCTGTPTRSACLNGIDSDSHDWGLHYDERTGFIYSGVEQEGLLFRYTLDDFADAGSTPTCVDPWLTYDDGTVNIGDQELLFDGFMGITTDENGNIYLSGTQDGQDGVVVKYNADGEFLLSSAVDGTGGNGGYNRSFGIVYSQDAQSVYVSSFDPGEDCITRFDIATLTPTAVVGPTGTGGNGFNRAKAMGIISECCPTMPNIELTETICSPGQGELVFLQDVLSCEEGVICEGIWRESTVPAEQNANFQFNECDLSITVNGTGCATYFLEKENAATGAQRCNAFTIEFELCVEAPSAMTATVAATCDDATMMPNDDAQINVTMIMDGDVVGISSPGATEYDGSPYDAAAAAADLQVVPASDMVDFTGLNSATTYWIRVFNMSNDCFIDYEVITPAAPDCSTTATVSLGSTVFEDNDNNGLQDSGEDGIPGVLVVLYMDGGDGQPDGTDDTPIVTGADGILGTADDAFGPDGISGTADDGDPGMFTDADGDYFFGGLSEGDYYVQIPATEFADGEALGDIPISSNTVNGFGGETDPDDNTDNDDEGVQMGSGTVTTSQIITLTVGGEPTDATTETAQGNDQDNPANGYVDADGNMTLDFGFFAPVSLGDTTWVDLNSNGLQDPMEPFLQGVTVTVFSTATMMPVTLDAEGNAYTSTTTTDVNGFYEFTNLPPGDYYVVFDITTAPGSEFYSFTTNGGTDGANNSDADPTTGQSITTGGIPSGARFPDLDAGVVCNVDAEAGIGLTICATVDVDLAALGANFSPTDVSDFNATWSSSGDGTFDDGNAGEFGVATAYALGENDILNGEVVLTLTTDDPSMPPFNSPFCGPVSDNVIITILRVDCGDYPWDGN